MANNTPKTKMNLLEKLANSQVWKSIFRTGVPVTRRQRMMSVLNNVFLHLPPGPPPEACR